MIRFRQAASPNNSFSGSDVRVSRSGKVVFAAAVAALLTATGASAAVMPTSGNFIGYGIVTAVSGTCTAAVGDSFTTQLELSTPVAKLVPVERQVFPGDTGPFIIKSKFDKTAGKPLTPSGTLVSTDLETGTVTDGTYTAIYTPLDGSSFGATVSTILPGTGGTCGQTNTLVYIRSSGGS